jgi:hypothetical protein
VRLPRDEREVSDLAFLQALDSGRKDLAGIRAAAETGDMPSAREALVAHFRTRKRPHWFFDLRDGRRGTLTHAWPSKEQGDPDRADDLLGNRFRLREDDPERVWDFGPDLKWRTAEMRQMGSTAYRLKRGNFFRDLAMAYGRTHRALYAAKFAALMNRWRTDWPLVVDDDFHPETAIMARGDAHDTMTTAHRWMAWMDCLYGGIALAPQVPVETTFGMLKSMWFLASHYLTYARSRYVPANHHLWERGTGPLMFGLMMPEFPDVAQMVQQAIPVIERHAEDSFLSDGGYEERTTAYTISAIRMFLIPLRLASLNGVKLLDREARARLRKCSEMVALLSLPNGAQPDVGDGVADASETAGLLGGTVNLLGSRTAGTVLKSLSLRREILPQDREAVSAAKQRALPRVIHYPDSGYFVARDGWTSRASALALSVPGEGIPNHSHDDALSLQLVIRGVPVIGTPMSELYSLLNKNNRARRQRARGHFYAMTSHNVVLVGGLPARSLEDLVPSWGPDPTPVEIDFSENASSVSVNGAHRAYPDVRVEREVAFRFRKGFTVRDRVEGAESEPHIARWHFEYGVEVQRDGTGFIAKFARGALRVSTSEGGRARLYRDNRWLRRNPARPGEAAPWVLDVKFGGEGKDELETRFEIV